MKTNKINFDQSNVERFYRALNVKGPTTTKSWIDILQAHKHVWITTQMQIPNPIVSMMDPTFPGEINGA